MPIKHQTESYRCRKGVRYVCWGDVFCRDEAKATVAALRACGAKAFFEKGDGGAYFRVFVDDGHPFGPDAVP